MIKGRLEKKAFMISIGLDLNQRAYKLPIKTLRRIAIMTPYFVHKNTAHAALEMVPRTPNDEDLFQLLEKRVGRLHLKQRLGLEADNERHTLTKRRNFFHLENWYAAHFVIRSALRLVLIHDRARRNALDIQVRRQTVHLPNLPEAFDGYTILQISDPHFDMNMEFPRALSERVRDIDYDLCVLTGDFRYETFGPIEDALAGLKRVRPHLKDPVFGILGNHDSIRMVPGIEAMGIRMLLNESVTFRRGDAALHIVGIDDPHYYRADNLDRACQGINHDEVSILLSHSPEFYQHAAHAGFDLMLCGHTHGGQICLPSGIPIIYDAPCPRKLARGPWKYHQLQGYTSVGAGSSIVDVRLNCLPEVALHTLRRTNESLPQ
jgi:predicted MPP superfamily phosphohydrolase